MQIERERLIDIREKVDRAREFHISHCRGRNFSFKYCSICSEGNALFILRYGKAIARKAFVKEKSRYFFLTIIIIV